MADEPEREGGRTALAGYMYQIIGVLALKALATDPVPAEPLPPRFEELVNLVRQGRLYHEYFDEDAVVELPGLDSTSAWILIQFKFSSQNPPATIGPKEYGEILDSLRASAIRLGCLNDPETQYWLMTNREYGPQTQNIVSTVATSARLTEDQRPIAFNLQKHDLMPLQDWKNHLKHFAKGVGCSDDEIDRGIQILIGMMIERTTARDDQLLTVGDLMKAFTTFDVAEHLTRHRLASFSIAELDRVKPQFGLPHYPIRRKILDKITDALKREFQAIIILKGDGGNGKSVALWHWAREHASLLSETESPFVVIQYVNWLHEHYAAKNVSKAARLSDHIGRSNEDNDTALARLERATPTLTNPRFCIGIDAVDDAIINEDKRRILNELLVWCWQQDQLRDQDGIVLIPKLSIIITCRDESEEVILNAILNLDREANIQHPRPAIIPVSEFDDEDLELAVGCLTDELANRIVAALPEKGYLDNRPNIAITQFEGEDSASVQPAHEYIINSLRHPAMWNSFVAIEDPNIQDEALSGAMPALHQLASNFLDWFYRKLVLRRHTAIFARTELQTALALIAAQSTHERQQRSVWLTVAHNIFGLHDQRMFREAQSAGLIVIDGTTWYWRHSFVRDYLVTLPEAAGAGEHG